MIDIALIREKPDWVKEQIRKLNDPAALERIDAIAALDKQRRALLTESETIQAARNKLNKSFGMLRGNRNLDAVAREVVAARAAEAVAAEDYERANTILSTAAAEGSAEAGAIDRLTSMLGALGGRVEALTEQVRAVESDLDANLYWIPNLPHESTPVGESEEQNIAWTMQGELYEFDFDPKPHWELGPALDLIDFERGVRMAGSRGYVLKGWGARLQRALVSFFLDRAHAKGYTELYVPYLLKEEMMYGSGHLPKFRDTMYFDPDADVFMLPTAEAAITNLHRDEIFEAGDLPLNYVAHTPCFRRERLSAGRDVRGIKRVHQFEKVEMYKFTTPEQSYAALETLAEDASDLCRALKLPFRRLEIVTGDLGFSATKKYDIEIWSPGCAEWLEVSSCSNCEDFQARRAGIRYRPEDGKKTRYVHTLNGSGLATPRVIIAIMENYQQADGSILIPDVLRPYLGGAERIGK